MISNKPIRLYTKRKTRSKTLFNAKGKGLYAERISITEETLQLWAEKMLANGVIDADAYNARKIK